MKLNGVNPKNNKRVVELIVLSDIHLGTYGCHAKELLQYLKSIDPKTVVLNGDIVDIWQFSKRYWPKSHMKVVKLFFKWISEGKDVHYITGNHDEMLRKFEGFKMGSFAIQNKIVLELDGKKAWFFHGDVFDFTMQHSKWIAKLGAIGYDTLIILNSCINFVSEFFGKGKISLSKKIKDSVKSAVKFINNFEETVSSIAMTKKYDFVICGHIHQAAMKEISSNNQKVTYLNSGDWVENLTALEYNNKKWTLYKYNEHDFSTMNEVDLDDENDILNKTDKAIFNQLVTEFIQ